MYLNTVQTQRHRSLHPTHFPLIAYAGVAGLMGNWAFYVDCPIIALEIIKTPLYLDFTRVEINMNEVHLYFNKKKALQSLEGKYQDLKCHSNKLLFILSGTFADGSMRFRNQSKLHWTVISASKCHTSAERLLFTWDLKAGKAGNVHLMIEWSSK